jgi:hypothetical protein
MKPCSKCGLRKSLDQFNKKSDAKDGHRNECRVCQKQDANLRYLRDPKRHKEKTRLNQRAYTAKKFGLLPQDLALMYEEQDYQCAICGVTEEEHGKYFAIDHCHSTGKVRGLLCMSCNTGLGNFRDRSDLLMLAIQYLGEKR